jgi:hypothetical protein
MDQALISLYHRHVAAACEQQMRLSEFLEQEKVSGTTYRYTTSTATLEFGNTVQFVALDLGSHADPDNSWLWTWCNPGLKLTSANRKLAEDIRELGRTAMIPAFTAEKQVSCDESLGPDLSPVAAHVFAVIVSGELGFDAHYTMPFDNGRFVVMIRDKRLRADVPHATARILTTFPQVLQAFPVLDQRAAFIAYVQLYGCVVQENSQSVRVLRNGEELLKANFDGSNRLIDLTGTIGPDGDS